MTCLQQKTTIPLTMSQNDPGLEISRLNAILRLNLSRVVVLCHRDQTSAQVARCKELVTCSQAVSHE